MNKGANGATADVHIIIFCWPSVIENTRHICDSIKHLNHRITVIDASGGTPQEIEHCHWVSVNQFLYYGSKFYYAMRLFDGDIMLQIQADAYNDDWVFLIETCIARFTEFPHLGIWSPEVDNTGWPTDSVAISSMPDSDLTIVSQTDCIVWGLRRDVITPLMALDYSSNNLGWGIDWAAAVTAYSRSMIAVRDKRTKIVHALGTGYQREEAYTQMVAFLNQLTPYEKALLSVLLKSCSKPPIF